ncbi:hypothetical protein Pcinc_002337 [Petrolisthes cinctipes]|uniref:Uncharacterized protein n=1 Tax=Petrolisthes cinctipes TaxID=88211 RepID=A0AAE1L5G9_PETCI|nr:hypothetical protein Pcinc_012156 [Petrolisthes cinctipes]KAK3886777.1 hypothetical protein Pcinc_009097 [Petrolisthes cinctipes]KAK3893845.1 hypothetical protein Pcinc_002337 [Petrolisthes cinctipes]
MVRLKLKNLRTYFISTYKKIKEAPSGSAGCPGSKWVLFDTASFLLDALVDQAPTTSKFAVPVKGTKSTSANSTEVAPVTFGERYVAKDCSTLPSNS